MFSSAVSRLLSPHGLPQVVRPLKQASRSLSNSAPTQLANASPDSKPNNNSCKVIETNFATYKNTGQYILSVFLNKDGNPITGHHDTTTHIGYVTASCLRENNLDGAFRPDPSRENRYASIAPGFVVLTEENLHEISKTEVFFPKELYQLLAEPGKSLQLQEKNI